MAKTCACCAWGRVVKVHYKLVDKVLNLVEVELRHMVMVRMMAIIEL